MPNYYDSIKSSLSINFDYIPTCLIDMILSYIIYPSTKLDTWINDPENEKYKTMLNDFNGQITNYQQVDDNYNTREYFFTKHIHEESVYIKFKLKNVEQVFNVSVAGCIYTFIVWLKDSFVSKHDYDLLSGKVSRGSNENNNHKMNKGNYALIVIINSWDKKYYASFISEASTLEKLYIYPFGVYTVYLNNIISDKDNLGFLTFSEEMKNHCLRLMKRIDYDVRCYDKKEFVKDLEFDQLYYFNNSESVCHFIFSLKDGRWAYNSNHTSSIIDIEYCLAAAVKNCCTIDKFVELQTDMLLDASVCAC